MDVPNRTLISLGTGVGITDSVPEVPKGPTRTVGVCLGTDVPAPVDEYLVHVQSLGSVSVHK